MVKPFDVAAHRDVYVSDSVQRRVLVFDIAVRAFEIGGEMPGQLVKPLGICRRG